MRTAHDQSAAASGRKRGFTLIEILVVISIIVVLIGIALPALTGAGRAARGAKTKAIMRDVLDAVDAFQIDRRRLPGYFSQVEMGAKENADDVGFTQMENALLDLAGGIVEKTGSNDPKVENTFRDVGPYKDDKKNVRVDTTRIGDRSQGAFLTLDKDTLAPVEGQRPGTDPPAGPPTTSPREMPDVLDGFTLPVMMWTRDLGGPTTIADVNDFAREESPASGGAGGKALFYWNANAGYLNARSLNGSGPVQFTDSALGGSLKKDLRERNLTAVLGSPAFPTPNDLSLPSRPRGDVILISAGADDGYFVLKGKPTDKIIGFGPRKESPKMASQTGPLADSFDDIILSSGG